MAAATKTLTRAFFRRDPVEVAPVLLNKVLHGSDGCSGRIVEVEAYRGALDPASHTFRGMTKRNATMFGEAGHLYVYFTYGMHWGSNVVCDMPGTGAGILLRALEPLTGIPQMFERRAKARVERDLCSGPGRLSQAMGITGVDDGQDLLDRAARFWLADDGTPPPTDTVIGPRIGISKGVEHPWRWYVGGNRHVSKR